MQKSPVLQNERLSRLLTSLLLCFGVLWPLLFALKVQNMILPASLVSAAVVGLLVLQGVSTKMRLISAGLGVLGIILLFFFPKGGLFVSIGETIKAVALYLNGVTSATLLFASRIGVVLAIFSALLAYAFSARSMGFIPALLMVALVMFGLWSMGQHSFMWYAAPALIAVLLLISQASHERSNLFQVLPMAALLVVLGMLIAPGENVVLPKLHEKAMELKQTITDYLFFSDSRKIFSLNDYGFYPNGKSQLGGAVEPGTNPVMTVKTDRKLLLRGVTKDTYTGRSWTGASMERRCLYINPRWSSLRRSVFLEDMPAKSVLSATTLLDQQAVTVQIQSLDPEKSASTLFVPVSVRSLTTYGSMVPYFNESSELFITRNLVAGDGYTVFAPVIEGGDSALGALINAAPERDDYYQSIHAKYTVLPEHLSSQQFMWDDLNTLLADFATPYDKACAIQRDLQRRYGYTLTPEDTPEDQDFVTHFLYVGKKGYCTYFASAMTVQCRMAGLPARYVEGFIAEPEEDGFAYVTEKNAHAWTEVYFKGFGWVPFDPTPLQRAASDSNEPDPTPTPTPEPTPTPPPPEEDEPEPTPPPEDDPLPEDQPETPPPPEDEPLPDDKEQPHRPMLWILLLILLLLAALAVWLWQHTPDQVAKRKTEIQDKVFVYGNACNTVLMIRGCTLRKGETPLRYARRLDKQKALPVQILPLWRSLALSNYSRMKPGEKQVDAARSTWRGLFAPQSIWTKLRFLLKAGFSKNCYRSLDTQLVHQEAPSPFGKYRDSIAKAAGKSNKKRGDKSASASNATKPGSAPHPMDEPQQAGNSPVPLPPPEPPAAMAPPSPQSVTPAVPAAPQEPAPAPNPTVPQEQTQTSPAPQRRRRRSSP
ncbi:MAG: hypothetical protein E7331_06480 [Clostridiales bacterium]|nr:hypothetical protein [Clostridiales bacterium]